MINYGVPAPCQGYAGCPGESREEWEVVPILRAEAHLPLHLSLPRSPTQLGAQGTV